MFSIVMTFFGRDKILNKPLTKEFLIHLFEQRVDAIDLKKAKHDVFSFLKNKNQIDIWSATFFKEVIQKINLV